LLREWKFDQVAEAFSFAGERQENLAVEETAVLLKRFSRSPEVEKAKVEFDRAQKVEERFHKDFDGIDFTGNSLPTQDTRHPLAITRPSLRTD
jgi:hypothetical protein